MDLFEEEILKPKKKKTINPTTIILIAIILLLIMLVATIVSIVYLKGTILTINLNGVAVKELEDIIVIEENNKVYMPIRRMAEYFNYVSRNGDYITLSEDSTKCYIKNDEELVSFTLNSNILVKVIDDKTEQIKIEEPIKEINQELYITAEGAQDAFNIKFYYYPDKNEMYIQTLSYLYAAYSQQAINLGYSPIDSESLLNRMAVLDGYLITKSNENYYGVVEVGATIGNTILETKYDNIEYLRENSDFLVESNGKKGIIAKDKKTKIHPIYDNIEITRNNNNVYYIVERSNLYGVLDANGKNIIYPEYDAIGIDINSYEKNGVTDKYILYNQVIPVKRNNKWALFNTNGSKVTDFVYDSFGCNAAKSNVSRTYGVLVVPEYNLIVVCQGGKYNLITLEGKSIFNTSVLDSVYITVSEGKNVYYIIAGGTTKELLSFLKENETTLGIHSIEQ